MTSWSAFFRWLIEHIAVYIVAAIVVCIVLVIYSAWGLLQRVIGP